MGVRFFMRQTPGEWVRGTAGVMINAELGWTQEGSWIDALAYPITPVVTFFMESKPQLETNKL
jgi:hypothetical protein